MNTFGRKFRIALSGESHNPFISVEIEGVPAGIPLAPEDFSADLARCKGGHNGTSPIVEKDIPEIIRGTCNGITTGTTLKLSFAKGGMTLPLVAAGVVAKKTISPARIRARLTEAGGFVFPSCCSDAPDASRGPLDIPEFVELLDRTAAEGDSIGGIVECVCEDIPAGIGDPFFDTAESMISHIAFAVPGIRGIEFGDGFRVASMRGSEYNDPFCDIAGHTNGNPVVFRVAVKPTSGIAREQTSINMATGRTEESKIKGRHDVCFALRVPVVIESIAAIYLCDAMLNRLFRL